MRISRPLAAVVAATAAATLVAGLASPAGAVTYDRRPAFAGGGWLSGQLTDGAVHNQEFDFDDYGLTIDVALALDAAGQRPAVVQQIVTRVANDVSSYIGYMDDRYAGNLGKASVLALVAHRDPRAFGGQDLITQLEDRVSSTEPIVGRIEDLSGFGDSANVFGQAFAARALAVTDSAESGDVTSFLLQQQCSAGYFRESFTADKALADQSCDGAPTGENGASTDATATAILALSTIKGDAAKAAVAKAVSWLRDTQRANGSFSISGKPKARTNANSTGLAGWALGRAGALGRAAKAAVWLRNLQVGGANPCSGRLKRQPGAIAYDQKAYAAGQAAGIGKVASGQWRRASAQALPALTWAPAAKGRFTATAPRTVAVGKPLRIELTGVAAGERVCVRSGKFSYEFRSGRRATNHVTFVVSRDPGRRTFQVYLGARLREVTVRVTR
ncbi:hypothetical protein ISU10_15400 [Nocardioides agariphilus]|jgi:hypothetical protein|uniref:Terpene cyclase/mutase family protein n=1 Tax=Nocardioides agariphilus TaxID=433664 RepID=A0A930YJG7_9ACTN|nr:hypothetical protein [Nocardioides agariphilus]MBF4769153.1 hypothetical protein [Nocardioides agariphilus]